MNETMNETMNDNILSATSYEVNTITPTLQPSLGFSIYEHKNLSMFNDRLLYTKAEKKYSIMMREHFDSIKESENAELNRLKITEQLVGDIHHEYYTTVGDLGEELAEYFHNKVKSHCSTIFGQPVEDVLYDNIWVNYQQKHEMNMGHSHKGLLSLVWYLDVPKEIEQERIYAGKPRGLIYFFSSNHDKFLDPFGGFYLDTKDDDFIMFSSWHKHMVYPFNSDVTRVSVSTNIVAVKLHNGELIYNPASPPTEEDFERQNNFTQFLQENQGYSYGVPGQQLNSLSSEEEDQENYWEQIENEVSINDEVLIKKDIDG